jgi:hypothetical protein
MEWGQLAHDLCVNRVNQDYSGSAGVSSVRVVQPKPGRAAISEPERTMWHTWTINRDDTLAKLRQHGPH